MAGHRPRGLAAAGGEQVLCKAGGAPGHTTTSHRPQGWTVRLPRGGEFYSLPWASLGEQGSFKPGQHEPQKPWAAGHMSVPGLKQSLSG